MSRTRIIIMGAAGRDFHDFLVVFRDDPAFEVVAFTATQIPGIDRRVFPAALAGPGYPDGIPIVPEAELPSLIEDRGADQVVFAYSDVSHVELMHKASLVQASGADFVLLDPERTMLPSRVPVISVCAVRTGVGKSGISKRVARALLDGGLRTVSIRHPMPYRDLTRMAVERYEAIEDLDRLGVTIEEREEYEHMVSDGVVVFAGVDYAAILREAEKEADVIIWDGGNNDTPFVRPDLEIVALDPHRPGHERLYHPGETNFLRADVLVVNKVSTASLEGVAEVLGSAARFNPDATVVMTDSAIRLDGDPSLVNGKRVLAIEDGPTVTHGGMEYGAGTLAARELGAAEIVDPRPHAAGSLAETFAQYPNAAHVLPAMGYSAEQLRDLEATIAATPCDLVLIATPIDLARLIRIPQPHARVTYEVTDRGAPTLDDVVSAFLEERGLRRIGDAGARA